MTEVRRRSTLMASAPSAGKGLAASSGLDKLRRRSAPEDVLGGPATAGLSSIASVAGLKSKAELMRRRRASLNDPQHQQVSSSLQAEKSAGALGGGGTSKWKDKLAEKKAGKDHAKHDYATFMKDGGGMQPGGLPKINTANIMKKKFKEAEVERKAKLAKAVEHFKRKTAESFQESRKLSTQVKDIVNLKKYFDNLIDKSSRTDGRVSIELLEKDLARSTNTEAGSANLMLSTLRKFEDGLDFEGFLKFRYPIASKADLKNMMAVAETTETGSDAKYGTNTTKRRTVEKPSAQLLKDLGGLWLMWDEDGNGELNKYEFREALKSLGVDDFKEFNRLYDEIDLNQNGSIDQSEFMAWWVYGSAQLSGMFEPGGIDADELEELLGNQDPLSLPLIHDYRVH